MPKPIDAISQKARNRPKLTSGVQRPTRNGTTSAVARLTPSAHLSRSAMSGSSAFFQRAIGPIPIRNTSGAMIGTNTALKYGGPTEILPPFSASRKSGYSVPSSTDPAATPSSTLFIKRKDSRDTVSNFPPSPTRGARHAKSASETPITNTRKPRMNTPRRGSVANACTEVRTPDRTRKVPSSDSENAQIASITVQLLKLPRFSVTASEWISAVPTSHGMNDAFSTGSQNHQPPQPSS